MICAIFRYIKSDSLFYLSSRLDILSIYRSCVNATKLFLYLKRYKAKKQFRAFFLWLSSFSNISCDQVITQNWYRAYMHSVQVCEGCNYEYMQNECEMSY